MAKIDFKPGNMLYPVPAVMVSCMRPGEKPNIITIAWAGTVCSDPAMVSISIRKERFSHDIIADTGEFVINLVGRQLTKATDFCGVKSGRDIDKFKETGLTAIASKTVSAPSIAESPVNIECKVNQILELGSHDMFIATVTAVRVGEEYMDEAGRFDMTKCDLTAYSHGEYFSLGEKLGKFGYSVAKQEKTKKTNKQSAQNKTNKQSAQNKTNKQSAQNKTNKQSAQNKTNKQPTQNKTNKQQTKNKANKRVTQKKSR